jgi:hypothetical protein
MESILSNIPGHVRHIVMVISVDEKLLSNLNLFLWFLPLFKQHKRGFFFYFLILALTDPISQLVFIIFQIDPIYFYAPSSILLLFVVLNYTHTLKPGIIIFNSLIFLVLALFLIFFENIRIPIILMAYFQFVILLNLTLYLVRKLFYRHIIYSYLIFLILYEFTIIIKSILYIFHLELGNFLIHFINIFEVFICFFYVIYNLKTAPRFHPNKKKLLAD